MNQKMMIPILFPFLAIITIIVIAGSLGIIFTVLEITMGNEVGVIILGTAITILVPLIAFLIQRSIEK